MQFLQPNRSFKPYFLTVLVALSLALTMPFDLTAQTTRQNNRAAATKQAATPTAAAVAKQADEVPFVNRKLANGLEVIVLQDPAVPLVTVELAVRNGSFTEPPELNGLSHLYEHMFFKPNRAVLRGENYLRDIGQLGITYNGSTREEVVNYYFTTPSPYVETAMRFIRDSAVYPVFDDREFAREVQVVIGEIDRNESNPFFYLNRALSNRLFSKYQSRKNALGSRETVGAATTEKMRLIQSRYYVPNNSALVITGDVEPERAFQLAEALFSEWKTADDPFKNFPLVEHPPLAASEGAVIEQPVQNVIINIGWHGPSIGKDDAATYAADVFSFIIRQPNSRFQRNLVDTGLVAGADFGYYTQRNVGPIQLTAVTTPDKARAALKAIYAELAAFNQPGYYTDEELESAKALLAADDLLGREKLSEYSHTLSFWWSSTGIEYFRGYQRNLRATSRADISRYIANYVQNKPHIGLALMSTEAQATAKLTPAELIGK